jgi:hypothetical protein
MRIDGLQFGDKVMIGSRRDLADGTDGTLCYVWAVGHYTTTRTPCGRAVVPYAGGPKSVVLAVPHERTDLATGTRKVFWEPELRRGSSLMAYSEWKIKNNAIRKQQREIERHQATMRRLHTKAAEAVRKAAKAPKGASVRLDAYPRSGKDRKLQDAVVSITLRVSEIKDLPEVKAWTDALAAPSPDECR